MSMISPGDRSIILQLSGEQLTRSALLDGLESWRHLELLTDEQVIEILPKIFNLRLACQGDR
ncbi:MAG: hypothetical protein HC772_15005 [Leptolyngbyaceae cyanobacterium CRU_2_3]|nr:hypothetical protein [Leptolyngbyaceae cyanobacterium CRU_2_3]